MVIVERSSLASVERLDPGSKNTLDDTSFTVSPDTQQACGTVTVRQRLWPCRDIPPENSLCPHTTVPWDAVPYFGSLGERKV